MTQRDARPPRKPASASAEHAKVGFVQTGLLSWFQANRRDLPWRQTRDPYRILVSEIMLQQTQVDRVLPHYDRFLERFPTVEALAAAPTREVIRAWAGLGYNRRAVNLQRTAQYVVAQCGGTFPRDVAALRALPGVGPYTAGAIACFAFEQDSAFVDTNMRRVLHRLFVGVDVPTPTNMRRVLHRLFVGVDVPTPTASDADVLRLAAAAVPAGNGWEWNQALIEFGALQCTARKPACVICPLQRVCCAYPAVQTALAELPRGVRLKRETPFNGSNRYYRGRVLAALRDVSGDAGEATIDLRTLGPRVRDGFSDDDVPWLYEVVQGLTKDGLAMVAEEPPGYDVAEAGKEADGNVRVRLP